MYVYKLQISDLERTYVYARTYVRTYMRAHCTYALPIGVVLRRAVGRKKYPLLGQFVNKKALCARIMRAQAAKHTIS